MESVLVLPLDAPVVIAPLIPGCVHLRAAPTPTAPGAGLARVTGKGGQLLGAHELQVSHFDVVAGITAEGRDMIAC